MDATTPPIGATIRADRLHPFERWRVLGLVPWQWRVLRAILFFAVALSLPFVLDGYVTYQFTRALVFAIALLGLVMLTGISGQFSFGHNAFVAFGAYLTAIFSTQVGLDAYVALAIAAVGSFLFGFLFGFPALRLSFVYLALATYALAVALPQFMKSTHMERWTGGVQGLYLERPEPPDALPLSDDQWWYLLTLAALVLSMWVSRNLIDCRIGRALIAVRENPLVATAMGVPVALYKTLIFGISALFAGIAGGFAALLSDFIAPDSFTFWYSIFLIIGFVIAGARSVYAVVLGGLLLQFLLPYMAGFASHALNFPAFGFVLIVLIWLMPHGAAGLFERLVRGWHRRALHHQSGGPS